MNSNIPKGCSLLPIVLAMGQYGTSGIATFRIPVAQYDVVTGQKTGEAVEISHGIFLGTLEILSKCLDCSLLRSNSCFPEVYFQSQFPNHTGRSYNPSGIVIIPYRLLYVTKPVEIDQEGRLVIYQNRNHV